MAQYDVHRIAGSGLVVDVQSDLLDPLTTRVVIPLLPQSDAPSPARRLNPTFPVEGVDHVLMPQFMAAVTLGELGAPIISLEANRDAITAALDMVFHGF